MISQNWMMPGEGLSTRAIEILNLLAEGMSDREIAQRLVISINTVKWYNRQIYSMLGVSSRTQAAARAHDIVSPDTKQQREPSLHVAEFSSTQRLPVEVNSFVGRKQTRQRIKRLLDVSRLLTLVGPPGTGKTRLALRIAWEVKDFFREGALFVSLAPVSDPAHVTNAIAQAAGVSAVPGQTLLETLKHALLDSHRLLILDNFEHLLPAAHQISELLAAAPRLKVLTTSREPLHLYGEQVYAVPTLELPDLEHMDLAYIAECESTALFIQRAQAVDPDFALTKDNALDIAKICLRLEGLPLAIELAAVSIKILTPRMLLSRLSSRLNTLTGGAHDLPVRQQTLRNTLDWSYNLLDEEEKKLFARLAVFPGAWSLESIEAICGDDFLQDVYQIVTSLVDKSLLMQTEAQGEKTCFVMLETIREYAREQLEESGEADQIRRRYAAYAAPVNEPRSVRSQRILSITPMKSSLYGKCCLL
jgi:predicted ATPase/DNA-binding CsgD family transcriptional regulator